MSIAILPARLANQIAAGEVVERPASVVKELIENSLDAQATKLHIDIEKGGRKSIRIIDNGVGIDKDELALALSRHATSKIKTLDDLERISSLGFRGEALASISSVSRLTLTSKPSHQATAWQAMAEGRDMAVKIQPAAHPDGTTIEVHDLFFNTPARRKFLRTDKTEFTHIDEVIRRIALAHFDVAITLTHNGKIIRQYPALQHKTQYAKRVAKICGQKFIENSVTIASEHDGLSLWGWVASADYYRNQNDLAYSYVNGRMMRDKLINHAIRQAYADSLPNDSYPAFVLFFELDHREVDVNVHPAKHEVRFHQGRYVHDFIYSVVHQALKTQQENNESKASITTNNSANHKIIAPTHLSSEQHYVQSVASQQDYITPLRTINDKAAASYKHGYTQSEKINLKTQQAYQALMTTPDATELANNTSESDSQKIALSANKTCRSEQYQVLYIEQQYYGLITTAQKLQLVNLKALAISYELPLLLERWQSGIVSQPLLLPQQLEFSPDEIKWLTKQQEILQKMGVIYLVKDETHIQIRQFPACLRHYNVQTTIDTILTELMACEEEILTEKICCAALATVMASKPFTISTAQSLLNNLQQRNLEEFKSQLTLNSVAVDLTSLLSTFK
jgi:DNA mismatch repair protein MutL